MDNSVRNKIPRSAAYSEQESITGVRKSPALSRSVQAQLGLRLRQFYESLALGEQSVPDRFVEIINRMSEELPEKARS